MATKIIQADREDLRAVETEEQYIFIFDILAQCGIPIEELEPCLPVDGSLTVQQRIALRKICMQYDVIVNDDMNGGIKIYVNDEVIAEWKKPHIVLRTDSLAKDRMKRLYIEIHCSWWSLFEEHNEQN